VLFEVKENGCPWGRVTCFEHTLLLLTHIAAAITADDKILVSSAACPMFNPKYMPPPPHYITHLTHTIQPDKYSL
jgi:hypothetical protein